MTLKETTNWKLQITIKLISNKSKTTVSSSSKNFTFPATKCNT